tara:strand:+ start:2612 stop:4108 length:1497 start_codon:yes stop_codon:yes gene_type:complete
MAFRLQSAIAGAAKRGSERLATIDETFRENIKLTSAKIAKDVEEVRKERTKSILDYSDKGKNLKRRYGLDDAQVQTILSGGMGAYDDFVEAVKTGQTQAEDPAAFDAKTYSKSLFEGEATSEGILSLADQAKAYATSRVPSSINVQTEASGIAAATQRPFGGLSTEDVVKRLNVTEDDKDSPTLRSDTGLSIKGVGGLTGAEIASIEQDRKTEGREDERFEMDKTAFDTNQKRQEALIAQIAKDEARANRGELMEYDQIKYDRARDEVEDLQTQSQLIQDAEAHVKNMESTDLSIEEKKLAIAKEKKFPAFKSYENMAVFASNALATGDFKEGYTKQDYKDLYAAGIAGVTKIANAEETKAAGGVSFSKPNRQTILNNEIKRTLQPVGLVEDIEGKITFKIEGNKPLYFESMTRALNNVTAQTKDLEDPMMDALIKSQKDSLKTDIKAFKDAATPKSTTKQQASSSAFIATLKPGDVITYTTANGKVITRLWTGRDYL